MELDESISEKMLHQVNVVGSLREHGVEDVEYFAKVGVNALGDFKPKFLKVGFDFWNCTIAFSILASCFDSLNMSMA